MVAEIAVGQKTNTQSSKQTNKEANKKE